ncbi:hypothetical protein TNCV_159102 [Trichonephila clavipes]|uniref:Uncharacterized protein n=1 Tax=Trichonephila clavipes TaxID=2585209 RepID=A0A8X6UUF5_TRICX|nr:hypothetical protein TNCV_159102 [Trichonephila clavipes]
MDSSHLQFVQNRDHFMPELSLENQIRTPTATTASTRMRSLADDNVDQLDIVADKINDLSVSQGINSVAVTSEQEHLQLEQLIAQLTQQIIAIYLLRLVKSQTRVLPVNSSISISYRSSEQISHMFQDLITPWQMLSQELMPLKGHGTI